MKELSAPRKATILVAEDYEDNRELLRIMLTSAGYRVRESANGVECLEATAAEHPDLIMVDLSMPLLDGWQLIGELRANPKTAKIPCVAVTAYGDADRQRALDAGFSGYISKPFRSSELFDVIATVLARRTIIAD
jgi:CheY-like chemotaxis protein